MKLNLQNTQINQWSREDIVCSIERLILSDERVSPKALLVLSILLPVRLGNGIIEVDESSADHRSLLYLILNAGVVFHYKNELGGRAGMITADFHIQKASIGNHTLESVMREIKSNISEAFECVNTYIEGFSFDYGEDEKQMYFWVYA